MPEKFTTSLFSKLENIWLWMILLLVKQQQLFFFGLEFE